MVRRSLLQFATVFIALLGSAAYAQTTYLNQTYNCIGAESHYPDGVGLFCTGGVPFQDASGNTVVKTQFSNSGRFIMYTPFLMYGCVDPSTATLPPNQEVWHFASNTTTKFTEPANGQPGTFNFDWQGYDDNGGTDPYGNHICGAYHYGSAVTTFLVGGPNWRGWYWDVLQPGSTFTIVQ